MMSQQALFNGVIFDEDDNLVQTTHVGEEAFYVIDDDGFRRHIEAEVVDRQVLNLFLTQLNEHKDEAVAQALRMMGKDDLFTKAAVDASIRNVDADQILAQGIPAQARDMMAMVGFRVVIDLHGEVIRIDQPAITDED